MRTILIFCGLILAGVIAWILVARPFADHYGPAFRGLGRVELGGLLDRPSDHLKKDVRTRGTVTTQCPGCGCWFFVKDARGRELRVEFGDTCPMLPIRRGRMATLEGQLIRFGEGYEFVATAAEFD